MQRAVLFIALAATLTLSVAFARAQEEPSGAAIVAALEKSVVEIVAKTEPSVVAIARVRTDGRDLDADAFDFRGGRAINPDSNSITDPSSPDFTPQEYATGVIVDRAGLIATTYHVLGDLTKNDYYVWSQRKPYKATVLAADPWLDLAVLKIEATELTPIKFGDAKSVKKGQFVIALGNPYALAKDGRASAKWGIVSNLQRPAAPAKVRPRIPAGRETLHHYGSLIETDAVLERGTSGGPLMNLAGEMIGLTTTYSPRNDVEAVGGLVIPVDQAFKDALEKLKAGRKAEFGFLGVSTRPPTDYDTPLKTPGAIVDRVVPGTPAAGIDLQDFDNGLARDVITHVDGEPVLDANALIMLLSRLPAEKNVQLTIERTSRENRNRPRTLQKQVTLSKKYVDSLRPAFATVVDPPWRGLTVDFTTATPGFSDRPGYIDPDGCIGVLEVDRNSPAWKAGLRPGMFVTHVGETRVSTPREFRAAVAKKNGNVKLRLTEAVNNSTTIIVAEP